MARFLAALVLSVIALFVAMAIFPSVHSVIFGMDFTGFDDATKLATKALPIIGIFGGTFYGIWLLLGRFWKSS